MGIREPYIGRYRYPKPHETIEDLAWAVINKAAFGHGEMRKYLLGDRYEPVQKRVNEILQGENINKYVKEPDDDGWMDF